MGKKIKKIIEEDGHVFDSSEELHMYWYFKELMDAGYVYEIHPHPPKFHLIDALKSVYIKPMKRVEDKLINETLFQEYTYSTDFLITWNDSAHLLFYVSLTTTNRKNKGLFIAQVNGFQSRLYSYIEVKPSFDQNNMTRLVRNTIKVVWDKYKDFINISIPEKVFNKTFTPKRFLFTDISKQPRKIKYKNVITLEEFLKKT